MLGITVREVLELPALKGSYVVGGASGLHRLVSGINVMEVPDIENYLRSGELLLTTTYPVKGRSDSLAEFIVSIASRNVSAVAIKTHRYLDNVTPEMIRAADEWAIPLIVLPDDTSFNVTIAAVMSELITRSGHVAPDSLDEYLTSIALAGGGLAAIAQTLASALGRAVSILNRDGSNLAGVESLDQAHSLSQPILVAGIEAGRIQVAGGNELHPKQIRLLSQASFAAGLHIAQQRATVELQRRSVVLYLEDLLSGQPFDERLYRERAKLFGWPQGQMAVLLTRCHTELPETSIAAVTQKVWRSAFPAWTRGNEIVVLLSDPDINGQPDYLESWRHRVVEMGGRQIVVSLGSLAQNPSEAAKSHRDAREALAIAERCAVDVVRHDDLFLERLILAADSHLVEQFVGREIGALLSWDAANNGELAETLRVYLGSRNAAVAAQRLFVHYNTLKHRMARIHSLLNMDLDDSRTRLSVALALEAARLIAGPSG